MKTIIFGNKDTAELAYYYLTKDYNLDIECFTVHERFITSNTFNGVPVVPFEEVIKIYTPQNYNFFAPIYASNMNLIRENIYNEIKSYGYNFISYISSKAYTWNCEIGDNCFILEGCNIQPFSKIGNNVMIWSFSHIGHHSEVCDNVFISSNVVVAGHNKIEQYSFLGSNCTTKEYTTIPEGTMIGQDTSVITNPEKSWGVWVGTPAKLIKSSKDIKWK